MAHAEKCPVCEGNGRIVEQITGEEAVCGFTVPYGTTRETILSEHTRQCHGCGGKGWVEVDDKPEKPQLKVHHRCCIEDTANKLGLNEKLSQDCEYYMQGEGLCGWPTGD